jgi:hypothetical protein
MGYRGKLAERERARHLRAEGATLAEIAATVGVAKSSASLWVRDVPVPGPAHRRGPRKRGPNALQCRKAAESEEGLRWGHEMIGTLSDRDLLIAGAALYAGEGSKTDGDLSFANTNPLLVRAFCRWLRALFEVEESKFRVQLYLHQGLDLATAVEFWSRTTGIPETQFYRPYRAVPDPSIRRTKHPFGCAKVRYLSSLVHRHVVGLVAAVVETARVGTGTETGIFAASIPG